MTRTPVPCHNGGTGEIHPKGSLSMGDLSRADTWLCPGLTPAPISLSFVIPCLMLLCSQRITSHLEAGLLFLGPSKGWPLWLGSRTPSGELSLQTMLMALAAVQGSTPPWLLLQGVQVPD